MTLVQAQALTRRAFVRLWESGAFPVRVALHWLLREHGVETIEQTGSVAQCERIAEGIARLWQERNATKCPLCLVPVRQDHAHAIVGGDLFHIRCMPPLTEAVS